MIDKNLYYHIHVVCTVQALNKRILFYRRSFKQYSRNTLHNRSNFIIGTLPRRGY